MDEMFGKKSNSATRVGTKVDLARIGCDVELSQNGTGAVKHARTNRAETWAICSIRLDSGEIRDGVIINISKTGARIRLKQRGAVSEQVIFRCPRYRLNRMAEVVWHNGFDIGVRFFEPSAAGG